MAVTLEWVHLPNDMYFCTICQNGIPIPEPTRYLLTYVSPERSTRTVRTYAQWLLPFFKWLDRRGLELTDLTRADLIHFRGALNLVETSAPSLLQKGADSKNGTVFSVLSTTLRFLSWAMGPDDTEPLFPRGPSNYPQRRRVRFSRLPPIELRLIAPDLVPHPKPTKAARFLTQQQLDACRAWIIETHAFDKQLQLRNRAIFEVMWDGALRRGALLGLRAENIDWLGRTILVSFSEREYREAWYRKRFHYRLAKTGEYQVVVADQTIQWLDRYRQEARPTEAVRLGHGVFFCEHTRSGKDHGQPLSLETLLYFFASMSQAPTRGGTGLRVTPHVLRHTWSAMAEEDDLPAESRQYQLGHASPLTTEKYRHTPPNQVRQDLQHWRQEHPERYGRLSV